MTACGALSVAGAVLLAAGCSNDRTMGPDGGTSITAGGMDTGDSGGLDTDTGDDGGSTGGGSDTGDPTATTNDPPGTAGEETSGGSTGGTTGDSGGDTGGSLDEPPDCSQYWQGMYIPNTMYMSMEPPQTAEEMFCYVNMERINYQFHGRNNGCVWDGDGTAQVSWPYEMEFDADLSAAAQAVADSIAAGGQPPGSPHNAGTFSPNIYVEGCASAEYTVSATNDDLADWPNDAAMSNSNGTTRMGLFYYDPGPQAPRLTRMGVGLSMTGSTRNWVVKLGE